MRKQMSRLLLILSLLSLASCTKKEFPDNLTCIPQDASLVVCVQLDSLIAKSEIKDFKQSGLYMLLSQDLLANHYTLMRLLENPMQNGLSYEQVFAFVTATEAKGISFELADDDDFMTLVLDFIKAENINTQIHKNDNCFYLPLPPNDSSILVWDEHKAMLLSASTKSNALRTFKTAKDNSILQNKDFVAFYKNRKELSLWAKNESFTKLLSAQFKNSYLPIPSMGGAGTFSHVNLQFLSGELKLSSQITPLDSAKKINAAVFNNKPDRELMKYFPAKALFLTKASLNKAALMQQLGSEEDLAFMMSPAQINAIKAWNGDVIAAVLNSEEYSLPQVVIGLSTANASVANFLFKEMYLHNKQINKGSYIAIPQQAYTIFVAQKASRLLISNNELAVKAFAAGKFAAGNMAEQAEISNTPAYLYMNLDINSYPIMIKSYLESFGLNDHFNTALLLKDVHAYYDEASACSFYKIGLKNNKKNSLAVIVSELGGMN